MTVPQAAATKASVVPALWPGESLSDVRRMTDIAREGGCDSVWYSEVNGYDALALSAAMAASGATGDMEVTVGPVPLGVRDPALLAQGLAVVDAFARGPVGVALGTSSPTVVEDWHGRTLGDPVEAMRAYLPALEAALVGSTTDHRGIGWQSRGFKLNIDPPGRLQLTLAALGDRMLRFAGAHADRVVINLVTSQIAEEMAVLVDDGADSAKRTRPRISAWLVAGSVDYALPRMASMLGVYANAPGYRMRLEQAGLLETTKTAPSKAAHSLGGFGMDSLAQRYHEMTAAGIDEIALVVSGADPLAERVVGWVVDERNKERRP